MPKFGSNSRMILSTCHGDLQVVMEEAIRHYDFSVKCGHRGEAEQNKAFDNKASKVKWPNSNHNKQPSMAVDIYPYPFHSEYWEKAYKGVWYEQACHVLAAASKLGIKVKWGGHFNSLFDGPHFELIKE